MSLTDDFVRVPAMEYAALMARLAEAEALLRDIYEHGANLTNWRDIEARLVRFVERAPDSASVEGEK